MKVELTEFLPAAAGDAGKTYIGIATIKIFDCLILRFYVNCIGDFITISPPFMDTYFETVKWQAFYMEDFQKTLSIQEFILKYLHEKDVIQKKVRKDLAEEA